MRATISGIRYDTDRAQPLGEVGYGEHPEDPERWRATFYRKTTTGEIFLAGSGGTMTRFKGKARILVLSPAERAQLIDWYGVKP
jgi:hypothetical protein